MHGGGDDSMGGGVRAFTYLFSLPMLPTHERLQGVDSSHLLAIQQSAEELETDQLGGTTDPETHRVSQTLAKLLYDMTPWTLNITGQSKMRLWVCG